MAGRPKANIDWNKVDRLLEAGCLTTEIAAHFGIARDSLYKRCRADHNCDFSTYSQQKKAKGESLLRAVQFKSAMDGNTTMQVWLGKQRLGQRDKPKEEQENDEFVKKLAQTIAAIEKISGSQKVGESALETE